jgi:hypothetical protein
MWRTCSPPPSEHLGLFWREKTSSFLSPRAAADELKLFLKLGK